jgi:hypothetical protein
MHEDPGDPPAGLRTDTGFNITAEATACSNTCDDISADRQNGLNLRRLHLEDDACRDKSSSDQGSNKDTRVVSSHVGDTPSGSLGVTRQPVRAGLPKQLQIVVYSRSVYPDAHGV